jgi:hypothetical protein
MREDLVMPAIARRLATEGLGWEPQIGDWCTVLGAEHVAEGNAGLWLVIAAPPGSGTLALVDANGQWPVTQVARANCLWLPTAGKLKTWLRAHGYRVATGEAFAPVLAASAPTSRHVCRLTIPGEAMPVDGDGLNEAEAVADALLRVLGSHTADSPRMAW